MPLLVEIGLTDLQKAWGAVGNPGTPASYRLGLYQSITSLSKFMSYVVMLNPGVKFVQKGKTSMNLFFSLHPSISDGVGWVLN